MAGGWLVFRDLGLDFKTTGSRSAPAGVDYSGRGIILLDDGRSFSVVFDLVLDRVSYTVAPADGLFDLPLSPAGCRADLEVLLCMVMISGQTPNGLSHIRSQFLLISHGRCRRDDFIDDPLNAFILMEQFGRPHKLGKGLTVRLGLRSDQNHFESWVVT